MLVAQAEIPMPKPQLEVSEYELSVLHVLWDRDSATIREITEAIYGEHTTAAHATVQKLLERLEKKDAVTRDRSSFAHTFRAKIPRSALIQQGLDVLADKLCEGSATPLLMHLVGRLRLSKRDRETLRKLINDADD